MIHISEPAKRFEEEPSTTGWPRAASRRHVGILFFLIAFLAVAGGLGLSASLHFPEVLLDNPSFAASLVDSGTIVVVASFIGLLGCGVLQTVLSRALAPLLPEGGRRPVRVLGGAAGLCWATSAMLGLILVPLWAANVTTGVPLLSGIVFVGATLAAPLLLAAWTVLVVRQFRGARVAGFVGASGLLLTFLRSSVWWLNTFLPVDEAFYLASAILTVLALLTFPVWVYWLIRMGVVVHEPTAADDISRHVVLAVGKRLGVGLLATAFVLGHVAVMVISTPTPKTDDVPSVPSAAGTVRYVVGWALREQFAGPTSYEELFAERQRDSYTQPQVPPGASLNNLDAGGVPAEYICADGATVDRVLLYLPGGGYIMPPSNGARGFAANVSRETGACVLMARYRLAPEYPFPAAVQDGVVAYRWLRQQGMPASQIAIFGDSAGGGLTLSTALSLRDGGDELPAALVSVSPCTDFTLNGRTFDTKAFSETLITRDTKDYTFRSYATSGAGGLYDPLLSPQFADPTGLPPTLLMAGSQEVLLDDSIRMANRLRSSDVDVKLEIWPGMPHAWNSARKESMETRLAVQHISAFISSRMGTVR